MTGHPLEQSFDALTDLVRLARSRDVPVFIYNAPVNPAVDMFFESEYRAYLARLQALAESEGAQFADLANAVAAGDWGYWIDGPDPIHVGERGHRTIAARLDAAFGYALARR
jgi:lysophospholipase L1-like esterase